MIKNLSNFLPFSGVSNFIYVLFESWRCCWLINIYSAISRKRNVKLWSYTFRFFFSSNSWSKRNFISSVNWLFLYFTVVWLLFLLELIIHSKCTVHYTRTKKKNPWNLIKNDWKFLFWAFSQTIFFQRSYYCLGLL